MTSNEMTPPVLGRLKLRYIVAGAVTIFIAFAAIATWSTSTLVERAVERDASRRSIEWTNYAVTHIPRIEELAQGAPVRPQEWKMFDEMTNLGGVFRFKIFSPEGTLQFESDGKGKTGADLGAHNPKAAGVLADGQPFTVVADGSQKANRPELYSETYLPVYRDGRLVAVAETYMDQTDKTAAVKHEYSIVAAISLGMIFLAMLIPSLGIWALIRRLKKQNAELEVERKRALASDKSKSEFLSTVTHELRTPLTSIKGSLHMLESGQIVKLNGTAAELLSMATRNSETLMMLVDDVLDIAQLESGRFDIKKDSTDLVSVVKDTINVFKSYGLDRSVTTIYTGEEGPFHVDIDAGRIAQVVRNFLSNAVKFSPDNGDVEVSTKRVNGAIRVSVKDRGCGIDESESQKIFEKFKQVDSSNTRDYGGTGLGLAISKEIIESHGGEIGFSSILQEGSEFYFDLPVTVDAEQELEPA